jgi:hypothetical protein
MSKDFVTECRFTGHKSSEIFCENVEVHFLMETVEASTETSANSSIVFYLNASFKRQPSQQRNFEIAEQNS